VVSFLTVVVFETVSVEGRYPETLAHSEVGVAVDVCTTKASDNVKLLSDGSLIETSCVSPFPVEDFSFSFGVGDIATALKTWSLKLSAGVELAVFWVIAR